ncbi:MAG: T9SS type A sorting domain-containing protein, partial [Bacteroidetes bacterium]|nr:T9SS type A sorting domain-containing protein [Bacteroidota bacterium]
KIYPNPMNNNGILNFSTTVDVVKIYDVAGKIIASGTKTSSIDLGNQLSQGIYIVELTSNNQTTISKVIR